MYISSVYIITTYKRIPEGILYPLARQYLATEIGMYRFLNNSTNGSNIAVVEVAAAAAAAEVIISDGPLYTRSYTVSIDEEDLLYIVYITCIRVDNAANRLIGRPEPNDTAGDGIFIFGVVPMVFTLFSEYG